ncbi:adenylate cyclase type 10-like isoform X1 [Sagmatias obliquidens]|uniref:adenylate cyclase type 10-like isoform X1 n=1 Tax=Sagmatias obliquidens TaxID=3371155 RepID=UPI000F44608B|nr:adenylate cyclase type 10-like isoform X1 [Lagenorhynchus obliquidens]
MATSKGVATPPLWPVEARLAALLPDLVVFRKPRGSEQELATAQGVLLGVHVTGFTALMDRFSLSCKSERDMDTLAHIFSYYISDIVEHVLCFGGDILNITGNVLLALWTVEQDQLSDIITLVAKCSLEIQEKFGIYHTREGQDLQLKIELWKNSDAEHTVDKVVRNKPSHTVLVGVNSGTTSLEGDSVISTKITNAFFLQPSTQHLSFNPNVYPIGLSAGRISQVIVGDEQRQYLLVIGRDVDGVQLAQRLAQANEIVLSWNCWKLCEQYMFEVEIMREDEAVKLRDMRIIDPFDFDEHFYKCLDYLPHYRTSADILRTALELDPDSALEQTLRKHIMKNLLKKIDEGQPMEYISEFRTVTMVLVSLEFHKTAWMLHLCHLIQEAALYISTVIEKGGGQLSRIFMSETSCMFLCVFGLPGDKKPDECAHALESSFSIFSFCWENLAETKLVSISITSGPVFCGMVGAVARHEYAVIGPKVSLVARMITAYPGLVSCDEVTYLRSTLPAYNFKKLPEKMMKNISNPGKMYEYLGHRRCIMFGKRHLARERNKNHSLLDREKELEAFRMAQQGSLQQKKGQAVLYEGGKGCGKSQLLAEINFLAQKEGHRVLPLKLKEADSKQCFYAIQTLMAIFFEIDMCPAYYRQERLHKQLHGMVEESLHCLFNDLFFVKFPLSFEVSHMDDLTRQKKVKACFFQVLQKAMRETPLIFLIDEAQYMDADSWEFWGTLLSSVPIIVVMTLTPTFTLCGWAQHFLQSPQAIFVPISKLAATSLLRMACWELGVVSIPQELQIYLLRRCFGNPLYCEILCQDLLSKNILLFHDLQKEEGENSKWETLSANAMKSTMYSISPASSEDQELYVCTVKDDVNLDTVLLPPLLKEIAVNQLDQLSPEEQLLVKCAAVIGHSFHIDLLQHLLPGWGKNKLLQVLRALVDIHVLRWCNKSQELPTEPILMPSSIEIIEQTKEERKSDAGSPLRLQEKLSLPQTEVLEFGVPLLQEAAWELWPKAQQTALHLECAWFLRDLACRCGSCHGGDFVPFHRFAICSTKSSSGTSRFCSYKDTGSILTQVIPDKLQLPSPQDSFQFQTKSPRSQEAFTREHCRTEEEFLDQVNRKLAQTSPEKDMLTMKPCHCKEVLKLVLSPLTQHCLVIGETTCAFYYLLEAAAASLDLSDNYMAFLYLRKASSLLGQPSAFSFYKQRKVKICQFEEATFCCLRSEVCFNMGQITLAKKLARQALRLLKRNFPWTWFGVIFQTFLEKCWRSCSLSQPPDNPTENKKKLAILQQQVQCLSLLWQLYNLEATASSRRFACLATLMQENSAKESASEAQVVSTYVALSQFSQNMGDKEKWLHCEQMAIQKNSLCWFSREGLLATAQLMQALAYTKLCLGHLDFSIRLGFQAREICRHLKKPALENLVLSVLFRSAFLKKKFDLCVHVLESQWVLISQGHDVLGLACFYSACLDLLLYGKGWLCRPFGECLHFIQHYEHSCILNSQSNVMLGVHSSLAMWFAQDSQWKLFEHHFSKAHQLVKRTNASLFGSHGFVRFLECHVLMLQKMPEGVFAHTASETPRQTLKYFKEFFSRCVTCPVYHQWVSELKASVMRCGKRESMSLTNVIRPFDTCLTRIWIEGEFLEENNSFEGNLQSKHSFLEPLSERHKEQSQILTHKQSKTVPPSKKGHADN